MSSDVPNKPKTSSLEMHKKVASGFAYLTLATSNCSGIVALNVTVKVPLWISAFISCSRTVRLDAVPLLKKHLIAGIKALHQVFVEKSPSLMTCIETRGIHQFIYKIYYMYPSPHLLPHLLFYSHFSYLTQ